MPAEKSSGEVVESGRQEIVEGLDFRARCRGPRHPLAAKSSRAVRWGNFAATRSPTPCGHHRAGVTAYAVQVRSLKRMKEISSSIQLSNPTRTPRRTM